MSERRPAAFMSYVRRVDRHDRGQLTTFRELLEDEVRLNGIADFAIFQDRQDIDWGEDWRDRIHESLDNVGLLIPVMTPNFFQSDPCRYEVQLFLDREKALNAGQLILPIYYIDIPEFNDPAAAFGKDRCSRRSVAGDPRQGTRRELRVRRGVCRPRLVRSRACEVARAHPGPGVTRRVRLPHRSFSGT